MTVFVHKIAQHNLRCTDFGEISLYIAQTSSKIMYYMPKIYKCKDIS